jgi:hypothetical protein
MSASLFQPALLAGVVIGVLSTLPVVSAGNCCCCMWVIGGGGLAAWLLQQNTARAITIAEGMLAGLLAGVVGAVIGVPISVFSHAVLGQIIDQRELFDRVLENAGSFPPELQEALERARESSFGRAGGVLQVFITFAFSLVINLVFATLGGLLGAFFFRRGPEPSNWGSPAGLPPVPPTEPSPVVPPPMPPPAL